MWKSTTFETIWKTTGQIWAPPAAPVTSTGSPSFSTITGAVLPIARLPPAASFAPGSTMPRLTLPACGREPPRLQHHLRRVRALEAPVGIGAEREPLDHLQHLKCHDPAARRLPDALDLVAPVVDRHRGAHVDGVRL